MVGFAAQRSHRKRPNRPRSGRMVEPDPKNKNMGLGKIIPPARHRYLHKRKFAQPKDNEIFLIRQIALL
jgi:hypothetical protein